MNDEYRAWLVDQIDDGRAVVYSELLSMLYDTEYRWTHELDENRAADGILLRGYFLNDKGINCNYDEEMYGNCTVLEMLVALSIKIETDLVSEPGDYQPQRWFWFMLDNLGLLPYVDSEFVFNEVAQILTAWCTNSPISGPESGTKYEKVGKKWGKLIGEVGTIPALFPVKNAQNMQIWDQINRFLIENV